MITISGIKCDVPHCNYKKDNVTFEEYPDWINKRCPVCNNILLSEEDYNRCVDLYRIHDKIDKVFDVLKWFNPIHYYYLIIGKERKEKVYSVYLKKSK